MKSEWHEWWVAGRKLVNAIIIAMTYGGQRIRGGSMDLRQRHWRVKECNMSTKRQGLIWRKAKENTKRYKWNKNVETSNLCVVYFWFCRHWLSHRHLAGHDAGWASRKAPTWRSKWKAGSEACLTCGTLLPYNLTYVHKFVCCVCTCATVCHSCRQP